MSHEETPQTLAQKLTWIHYQSPKVQECAHNCRECSLPLLRGQPCGAYCYHCALKVGDEDTEDLSNGGAVAFAVIGIALLVVGFFAGVALRGVL